jgi:hypothetical protein
MGSTSTTPVVTPSVLAQPPVSEAAARTLLGDLETGRVSLTDRIAPERGLTIREIAGEDDARADTPEPPPPTIDDGRFCQTASGRLHRHQDQLVRALQSNQESEAPVECHQDAIGTWCRFDDIAFEYATAFDVYFVPCDAGTCIDGLDVHAGGSYPVSKQDDDRRAFETVLRAARATVCGPTE